MTQSLVNQAKNHEIQFSDVIAYIDQHYTHTPTAFQNGQQSNTANENQGSAKVLYFAKLHHLSRSDTLALFVEHYQNVLASPDADNHQNIRQFILHGLDGVTFDGTVLTEKA